MSKERKYSHKECCAILYHAYLGVLGVAYPNGEKTVCIEQAARPGELTREGYYRPYDNAISTGKLSRKPGMVEIRRFLLEYNYIDQKTYEELLKWVP